MIAGVAPIPLRAPCRCARHPSSRRPRCCLRARRWPRLLDGVDEPLLLFDDLGRLSFGNRAAMRLLGAEPGLVGGAAGRRCWAPSAVRPGCARGCATPAPAPQSPRVTLADARRARSCRAGASARDLALRVQLEAPRRQPPAVAAGGRGRARRWRCCACSGPRPSRPRCRTPSFRLVEVNDAYLDFTGRTREALIGTDPVLLQPLEDQATHIESRARAAGAAGRARRCRCCASSG